MVSSVNVGRAKESIKIGFVCLDFASVVLVEPLPVAPLRFFFFKRRHGGCNASQNCISRRFLVWAFEIVVGIIMSSYNFVLMFKVVAHNSRKLTVGNHFCQGLGMQRMSCMKSSSKLEFL